MDILFLLFSIFISLEFIESNWQKADSLYEVLINNFLLFKKNIFLYFIMHITFFYTIFLSFYFAIFGFWMSSLFFVKFLVLSFKLAIMKKLSNGASIEEIMAINIKMTPILRYFNVIVYPLTFLFAMKMI